MSRIGNRVGLVTLMLGALALAGCVNEAGNSQRYRVFEIKPEQLAEARQLRRPYIINNRGHIQTIQSLDFYTQQWGRVRLMPNYVSNMAALLHDALYRGAPELTFPHGYPGRWTRLQADRAYCLQLKRQGAAERLAKLNCGGVNILGVSSGVWRYHRLRREAYWKKQESRLRQRDAR